MKPVKGAAYYPDHALHHTAPLRRSAILYGGDRPRSWEKHLNLVPIPALVDNYIWLLHDSDGNAVIVDPGDGEVVQRELEVRRLRLQAIFLTHHHQDHTGGVADLIARWPVAVFAPGDPRIRETTRRVGDGDVVALDLPHLRFMVIAVPGHTRSHIAFFGEGLLLSGDTLFSLGCGRLFEGTPAQMLASLDRLAALPAATQICAAHEYTEANGRFAHMIEPVNQRLQARREQVAHLRMQGRPTLPTSLGGELATNPFLRVDTEAVLTWCHNSAPEPSDRVNRFARLRAAKDAFS